MPEPTQQPRDRSFGTTVLVGLAAAGLAVVADGKDWARASGDAAGVPVHAAATGSAVAPLAVALALVGLASWGVLLVTRGRVRRVVAAVGSVAMLVSLLAAGAFGKAHAAAVEAVRGRGAIGDVSVHVTAWQVAALLAAAVGWLCLLVAARRAHRWPAMGSGYDAPGARAEQPVTDQDLWRALDEGHDPTL